ncbi:MAG: hypothetical protein ABJL71_18935 [Cyclobacteriaceae bacterium]
MTLGFSLYFDKAKKRPTHFPERVLASLSHDAHVKCLGLFAEKYPDYYGPWFTEKPKLHTIRADEKDRWRPGMDIHFVVGNRTPNRYQFAPVVKCTEVQNIEMIFNIEGFLINVDGKRLTYEQKVDLAINDGFISYEHFLNWFVPICEKSPGLKFEGKIIHWTDTRY